MQRPDDCFGTRIWPPFYCFGTVHWTNTADVTSFQNASFVNLNILRLVNIFLSTDTVTLSFTSNNYFAKSNYLANKGHEE